MNKQLIPDTVAGLCLAVLILPGISGCQPSNPKARLDNYAEEYVVLALGLDLVAEGEVDGYFGPQALNDDAVDAALSLDALALEAGALAETVAKNAEPGIADRSDHLLAKIHHLQSLISVISAPQSISFAEEIALLYGLSVPDYSTRDFQSLLDELDELVPGRGSLPFRVASWRNKQVIPADKRQHIFESALAACREQTLTYWELPAEEALTLEWTRDVQAAWHEYEGAYHSNLKLNPLTIAFVSSSVDLACHEAYPGHHAQFLLMEMAAGTMLPVEDTVVLLRSPESILREGAANAGITLAFSPDERLALEQHNLSPLAGLNGVEADKSLRIHRLMDALAPAVVPVIQEYMDGDIIFNAASFRLEREALISSPVALLEYVNDYGTYSVGYTMVRDMIDQYLDQHTSDVNERWEILQTIVVSPDRDTLQALANNKPL